MNSPRSLEASGFFALRTPLAPLAMLIDGRDNLCAPKAFASRADLDAAIAFDRTIRAAQVRAQLADPSVREALFVASPSLDRAIDVWLTSPNDPRADGALDVVARYLARMAARPTPFGLFSGCSVGTIDTHTKLELAARRAYRRHTRLDVHYLSALCDDLGRDNALRARAIFRPSDGIFETPTQLRYPEASTDPKTRARAYALISIERSGHLDAALARARSGATRAEIAEAVAARAEASPEQATIFVDSLIDCQVLVSDLAPVVTGPEPLDDLIETLCTFDAPATETLESVRDAIRALDAGGTGAPTAAYGVIAESLAPLPTEAKIARLFQVDLYKPMTSATLGRSVVREIARATDLVARISSLEEPESLRHFREAFQNRYEGREVPLLEALDEETGIGFSSGLATTSDPSPLLENLRFPPAPATPRLPFGPREQLLMRRIESTRADDGIEWRLDEGDLEVLEGKPRRLLPDAFATMATVAAASGEAADRGDYRVLIHWAQPSGAQLLGRFCHGDPYLRGHVERHLRAEEATRADAIFAEIVHLPEGRMGNILCRPVLRDYEITYLGRGGAPIERRIPVSDLRVSLAGRRIILRSARLQREIVPRLSSAHNTSMAALGVYRFLSALSSQDAPPATWTWGALASAPFLPRVTQGRAILSLAQWRIVRDEFDGAARLSSADRYRRAQAIRASHRLPRWVSLVDGDNLLPLDLDDTVSVDTLASLTKGRDAIHLTEMFPGEDDLLVSGPEGRFTHEIVVPFVRAPAATKIATPSPRRAPSIARRFTPGSKWLYAKLYTGDGSGRRRSQTSRRAGCRTRKA